MSSVLRSWWEAFTGSGDHAVTVPPMDGPLHPNTALEAARRVASVSAPESLSLAGGRLALGSGRNLLAIDVSSGATSELATFDVPITAVAASGDAIAVALDDGTIVRRGGAHDGVRTRLPSGAGRACPVALLVDADGAVTVANGSSRNAAAAWKRDLMEKEASGSIWRLGPGGDVARLAAGLAFPFGLARMADGGLAVCESWRHRIVRLEEGGRVRAVLSELPCYPARLAPRSGGGWWLAAFAPRTQMVEFMLRETAARRRMIATIDPEYWMAPRYASGRSFKEPLQGGGIKHLGILKPWAPSQSYGLVVALDDDMQPEASYHSRADGTIHGVTSCVELGGRLFAASRSADAVVAIELGTAGWVD